MPGFELRPLCVTTRASRVPLVPSPTSPHFSPPIYCGPAKVRGEKCGLAVGPRHMPRYSARLVRSFRGDRLLSSSAVARHFSHSPGKKLMLRPSR